MHMWYAIHPHRLIMSYARLFCPPPGLESIQCFHRRPTLFLSEENVFISKSLFFSVRKKQGVTTICAACAKNSKVVGMIHSLQHTQVHISMWIMWRKYIKGSLIYQQRKLIRVSVLHQIFQPSAQSADSIARNTDAALDPNTCLQSKETKHLIDSSHTTTYRQARTVSILHYSTVPHHSVLLKY